MEPNALVDTIIEVVKTIVTIAIIVNVTIIVTIVIIVTISIMTIVILKVVEAHAKDLVIYSSFHPDICTM